MTTVKDVLTFIETLAPTYMKEDWDRVGLNCGHPDKPVTTVLVALDPFEDVCQEALEIGAELIVTHHALIWTPGLLPMRQHRGETRCFSLKTALPASMPTPTWTAHPAVSMTFWPQSWDLMTLGSLTPEAQIRKAEPGGF